MFFVGANKAKSMTINSNVSPIWPQTQVEISIDIQNPIEITIMVYHIDVHDKREICIGQVDIPFETLLRPPNDNVDLFLAPAKKNPPKKYKFIVGGSVSLLISSGSSNSNSVLPFSSSFEVPIAALSSYDNHTIGGSKDDRIFDGDMMSRSEEIWLGTNYDFTKTQTLPSNNKYVVVPIRDMGLQLGELAKDFVGEKPGFRAALCIERTEGRFNVSDATALEEVRESIQHRIIQSRRKEIYRKLRIILFDKYYKTLIEVTKMERFNSSCLQSWLVKALKTCFPGITIYTAYPTQDFSVLNYTVYEPDGTDREVSVLKGQGFDWEFAGRTVLKSVMVKTLSDVERRSLVTFKSYCISRHPRIVVPMVSGDVSLGVIGVENFDVFNGGRLDTLTAEYEVRKWIEDLGSIIGESLYTGKERKALRRIESYVMGWSSTQDGLVYEILKGCVDVIQGCNMMEIWAISQDYKIQSLALYKPPPPLQSGRIAVISKITVSLSVAAKAERFLLRDDANVDEADFDNTTTNTNIVKYVFGIRYDEMEQSQVVTETEPNSGEYVIDPMRVMITNDRNMYVSMYEINEDLSVNEEYYDKVVFSTFQEKSVKVSLGANKSLFGIFIFNQSNY
jgi:hypothetical protein